MVRPIKTRVRRKLLGTKTHSLRFDAPHRTSRELDRAVSEKSEPRTLLLTPESALHFEEDVAMALATGQRPTIQIQNTQGLNPEFVRRMLREHPTALLTTQAYFQLSHPLGPQSAFRSRQRVVITVAAAMLAIATLLVGSLLAS